MLRFAFWINRLCKPGKTYYQVEPYEIANVEPFKKKKRNKRQFHMFRYNVIRCFLFPLSFLSTLKSILIFIMGTHGLCKLEKQAKPHTWPHEAQNYLG